ncbi:SDR family NAD(P)-dependent oxidoreductase [Gordonia amarae]|uniref:SDR family NAD(P)-dependent oxidoreductase n=2 Tax=Gordonia amarae TaxID=36821 RepID=A0A857M7N1_9ACTN|nr:SDR family NAD(P)-dependent oxidoreductase [Gordonia amarae]MCS3877428.1 NAD(P)-dependent dehydrogenase (short-subunit alcohol dehydrogenase family) [Gordonia amarae]QHN16170.1 SDR family NAD(P)-dependent oxidoreductase [Gordonia amarae]QHN20739.1 SDR family NAD(P)-dependent oxidoreductase [Gordonia amarae]QHN29590.1 SDR family NAD(P)-dependent oxidoreductase [Gordonia amarae]QHN38366.1 SDR family NAD(P)-dependent oxidoreductase [Gordonia amarae]
MTESPKRLVVITGAAGALGQAVVSEFLNAGAAVAAVDIPGERLDALGETDDVHAVGAQLSDAAQTVAAWEAIDAIGTPDTLVTLAGGFQPSSLADLTEDIWDAMIDSNVDSLVWSAREAARRFEAAGGGSIVTVGSKTAISGPAPLAHATSKAAVVRITELLADELRPKKIRVNAVLPSVIDTPANRTWMSEDLASRAVSPAAIAKVIAFLASADAAPISGARVPVYGDA